MPVVRPRATLVPISQLRHSFPIMSIRVALHHVTRYRYDRLVTLGPQVVRLRPAPHCRTSILAYSLKIEPSRSLPQLAAGSAVELARANRGAGKDRRSFSVAVDLTVELNVINPFDFFLEPLAEKFPFDYPPELPPTCGPICARCECGKAFHAYLDRISREKPADHAIPVRIERGLAAGHRLSDPHGAGHPDTRRDAWKSAPARAAIPPGCWCSCFGTSDSRRASPSGYLIQLKPDVKSLDGPSGADVRFHRSARLVRSLSAWRGLGRARPDIGSVRRRRPHPAGVRRQSPTAASPISGELEECEVEFDFEMTRLACARDASRHKAVHGRSMARDRATSATRSTRSSRRATCG